MGNQMLAIQVSTIQELNAAIQIADGETANSGGDEIELAANANIELLQALTAINLASGVTLDIADDRATRESVNETTKTSYDQRGLFVYAGAVTVENLTIAGTKAIGGACGAGGGPGFGAGLLVGSNIGFDAGDVTLACVSFTEDSATGGVAGAPTRQRVWPRPPTRLKQRLQALIEVRKRTSAPGARR